MSDKQSIGSSIAKYVIQWLIGFGLLYVWIKDDPDKQWYWWVALAIFGTGLVLMALVIKLGNKAADAISEKLIDHLNAETKPEEDSSS